MVRNWWTQLKRQWTTPGGSTQPHRHHPVQGALLRIEQLEDRLTPASIVLGTAPLAIDVAGESYTAAFTATGGSGQYQFSLASGTLPTGLSISSSGMLSGQTTVAGAYKFTVEATDATNPKLVATRASSLTVSPSALATVLVSAPATVTAGAAFKVTLTAEDSFGNIETSSGGTVPLTSSDGQTPSQTSITLTDGVGSVMTSLKNADTLTLAATDGSVTGTSGGITVNPGAASTFVVATPSTATAGNGFSVGLTAYDKYGNVATGFSGTAMLTTSDKQVASPNSITVTDGVGSGTVTLTKADTLTLTVAFGTVKGTSSIVVSPLATVSSFTVTAPATATAGVGATVTVTARDVYGNVVTGYSGPVTFTSSSGQTVSGSVTLTNGVWTGSVVLDVVGSVTLAATNGSATGTSGTVKVGPALAASFVVTAPSTVTAGTGFSVTITAFDAFGNVATTTTGPVTLTSSDGQTVSNASITLSKGTATGSHILTGVDTVTLTAVEGTATGTSGGITVSPGAASLFVVSAPSTATAGTGFSVGLTAYDKYGNVATGFSGAAMLTTSDKQVASPNSITMTDGVGSGTVTLTKADTLTLMFASGTVKGTSSIVVSPLATVSSFTVTAPATATAGVGATVTVTARDVYGNVVTGYSGPVTFTSSSGQTVSGSVTLTNGVWTGSVVLDVVGSVTLAATNGSATGTSGTVKVGPALAASFVVTALSTVTAGTGFSVTITAFDAFGNVATTTTGPVTLTSSDGQAITGASVTLSRGAATGSHILTAVDTVTLTATEGSATGTSGGITVNPGAASAFVVTAPATATVATAFSITLTAVDKYGNTATGFSGPATLAASDRQVVSPSSITMTNGVGTGTVTLNKSDTVTLSATAGTVKGTSGSITVQGGNLNNWIAQNLSDSALATLAQTDFTRDGSITYGDMLGLFALAESEGSTVSSATLSSLQALASAGGAAALDIPAAVQGLTGNVVDSNPANAVIASGNLRTGSTSTQLQTLVSDWFLGADHPSAVTIYGTATYQLASGTLFGSGGPSYKDIYQGQMGDCWLMASFGATAANAPSLIESMFTDDGTQTENGVQVHVWTVRFYDNGVATYLSVDNELPTVGGQFFFANQGQSATNSSNVLWAGLLEKAYAQLSASGWNQRPQADAYDSLNGGLAATVLPVLTGQNESSDSFTNSGLTSALAAGRLMTLATFEDVPSLGIVGGHDYTLLGYNSSTQTYTLMNPWGWNSNYSNDGAAAPGILHLTWSQVQQYFVLDGDCNP